MNDLIQYARSRYRKSRRSRFHVGLRTIKTVAAVLISMLLVEIYGTSTSKLIFAMLGAMAAVQPTFIESLEACLSQIIGVFFGCLVGIVLYALPISHLAGTAIGMTLVIVIYNALRLRYSPSLPCFVVVLICTTPHIHPFVYSIERMWDSAIGLGVGMLINTLVFPYDNRWQIRSTMESLDREVILFLNGMFDGDDNRPDSDALSEKIARIYQQLQVFSKQFLFIRPKKRRRQLSGFQEYVHTARHLASHMEILCHLEPLGCLSKENYRKLVAGGAEIRTPPCTDCQRHQDEITNYHVEQILKLRQELLDMLHAL